MRSEGRSRAGKLQPDLSIGSVGNDGGDGNVNGKKAIGLISKTTTLHVHHTFLYISLPALHDYDGKMPILSRFVEDVNVRQRLSFFPLNFDTVL